MRHDIVVSVISPIYRGTNAFAGRAYSSLLAQEYPYWEWVIGLNNGGTAPRFAESDPRVKVIILPDEWRNVSKYKQACAENASGDVIAILDADDLFPPWALRMAAEVFQAKPWVEAVIGSDAYFAEPGSEGAKRNPAELGAKLTLYKGRAWWAKQWYGWHHPAGFYCMPSHFLAIRRRVFEIVGGWNSFMSLADDYGFCTRCAKMGVRAEVLPDVMYLCRWHDQHRYHAGMGAIGVETSLHQGMAMRTWPHAQEEENGRIWLSGHLKAFSSPSSTRLPGRSTWAAST